MSDGCPLCQAPLEHRAGRGLELRRFPHGRMVCLHDLKGWHLQLISVQREIELCRDEMSVAHLRTEFEDMLIQHTSQDVQRTNDATHQQLERLETA